MNIPWDAERYTRDFSFVPQYGSALLDWIEGENRTVLDLGCGSGALTKEISRRGHEVEGIDASDELLQMARARYPELRFTQADAVSFRMGDSTTSCFPTRSFTGSTGRSRRI